ncbi:hypothetical protein EW146_g6203 [Bondarzewia mesenterica]|uniref:Uncharacterized protein n=1 Tax=Bondarzewia mesenterica TaxID=1095465 RepID=A0A4S4LQ93_9AGAM|nr:hypothetical protein EW146_g6203 [Bondarzewia mesenterica]
MLRRNHAYGPHLTSLHPDSAHRRLLWHALTVSTAPHTARLTGSHNRCRSLNDPTVMLVFCGRSWLVGSQTLAIVRLLDLHISVCTFHLSRDMLTVSDVQTGDEAWAMSGNHRWCRVIIIGSDSLESSDEFVAQYSVTLTANYRLRCRE